MSRGYSGEDNCRSCGKFAELDAHNTCTLCYNAEILCSEDELCKRCGLNNDLCHCICEDCGAHLDDDDNYCDTCNPPEPNDDEDPRDDRGDGDFNERGGFTRSYIEGLNKGFR